MELSLKYATPSQNCVTPSMWHPQWIRQSSSSVPSISGHAITVVPSRQLGFPVCLSDLSSLVTCSLGWALLLCLHHHQARGAYCSTWHHSTVSNNSYETKITMAIITLTSACRYECRLAACHNLLLASKQEVCMLRPVGVSCHNSEEYCVQQPDQRINCRFGNAVHGE